MDSKNKSTFSTNPFKGANTSEEKEKVWSRLKSNAVRLSREEGEKLLKEAVRLQNEDK